MTQTPTLNQTIYHPAIYRRRSHEFTGEAREIPKLPTFCTLSWCPWGRVRRTIIRTLYESSINTYPELSPEAQYRNLIKKPWGCMRVLNMSRNIVGLQGQGFLIGFLHHRLRVYRIGNHVTKRRVDSACELVRAILAG